MLKTPSSTVIGGAGIWTPNAMIVGSANQNLSSLIKSLFANNEQGFAYDPNDLSTMFQDSAGTVPVTTVGQPVGLIRDKSGRNNHAYQATSASRPMLRKDAITGANYLEFDGTDDFLQTSAINFTTTDEVSLFAGVRKLRDTNNFECLLSFANNTVNGAFALMLSSGYTSASFENRGTLTRYAISASMTAPHSNVLSAFGDIVNNETLLSVDRMKTLITTSLGGGNYNNSPIYIGRRDGTTQPAQMHLYGLIGVGRLSTDTETKSIEQQLAKRTGVTLSV